MGLPMMGECSFSSSATVGDDARSRATEESRAFDEVYHRFHQRLSRYAFRKLGDAAAAEDVAQESLVRAWQRRDRFTSAEEFAPWLWRVARNLCVDVARARRRVVSIDSVPEQADATPDALAFVEAEEERLSLRSAFGSLSKRHREALYLRDVKGLGYEELATHLDVSEEGARCAVSRARGGLRHAFEGVVASTLAALGWLRARIASRMDNVQLAAAGMQALVVMALSAAAAVAGTVGGPDVHALMVGTSAHDGVASDDSTGGFLGGEQLRRLPNDADGARDGIVSLRVDRKSGSASLGAGVPLGPEQEEYVWVRVWREHEDDDPSHALSTVDEAGETVCGTRRSACGAADEALTGHIDEP